MQKNPFFFTATLILLLSTQVFSQDCAFGQIKVGRTCRDCPPGTFLDFLGIRCQRCPRGTFQPFSRAPNEDACRFCLDDTFNPDRGATACKPCPPGTIAARGASICVACGPGTELGLGRCTACREGFYSTATLNRVCKPCPGPLTGPVGSKSRSNCKRCNMPGSFGSSCNSCDSGSALDSKTGECKRCPAGRVSLPRFAFSTRCGRCRAGTFANFGQRRPGSFFSLFCQTCPPGTTSGRGATACRPMGQPCGDGFAENRFGGCVKCHMGFFFDTKKKDCVRCPAGTTSSGGSRTGCVKCTGELVSDSSQALCRCLPGRFFRNGKCFDCPAGTGGNFDNPELRGRNGCLKCDRGFFQDQPGQPACKRCPFGTVAERTGSTSCKPCPEGSVPAFDTDEETSRCATIETGCPIGFTYRNFWGVNCQRIRPRTAG